MTESDGSSIFLYFEENNISCYIPSEKHNLTGSAVTEILNWKTDIVLLFIIDSTRRRYFRKLKMEALPTDRPTYRIPLLFSNNNMLKFSSFFWKSLTQICMTSANQLFFRRFFHVFDYISRQNYVILFQTKHDR